MIIVKGAGKTVGRNLHMNRSLKGCLPTFGELIFSLDFLVEGSLISPKF